MFMVQFIYSFSPTCFGRYCGHLLDDTSKTIQSYKCGYLCRRHSIKKSCKGVTATQLTTFVLL